jgi:hypothetical protein
MTVRRGPWLCSAAAATVLAVLLWATFTPIKAGVHEEIFEIPRGTWARRMAGDKVDILPSKIWLTLGVRDVLVLINRDDVPQVFGPVLMMPGQSFRLPFAMASSYQFACSAHASGQMTVIVDAMPASAWARLIWRIGTLVRSGRWP